MSDDSKVILFPASRISRFPESGAAQVWCLAQRLGGAPQGCRRVLEQIRYCRLFDRPYKEAVTTPEVRRQRRASQRAAEQLRQYLFGHPNKRPVGPFVVWDEELGQSVFERPYKVPNAVPLGVWEAAALPVGARWETIAALGLPI